MILTLNWPIFMLFRVILCFSYLYFISFCNRTGIFTLKMVCEISHPHVSDPDVCGSFIDTS